MSCVIFGQLLTLLFSFLVCEVVIMALSSLSWHGDLTAISQDTLADAAVTGKSQIRAFLQWSSNFNSCDSPAELGDTIADAPRCQGAQYASRCSNLTAPPSQHFPILVGTRKADSQALRACSSRFPKTATQITICLSAPRVNLTWWEKSRSTRTLGKAIGELEPVYSEMWSISSSSV